MLAAALMTVGCQSLKVADRPPPAQAPASTPSAPTTDAPIALPLPPPSPPGTPGIETAPDLPPAGAAGPEIREFPLPGDAQGKTKVGILLPLSGPDEELGQEMLRASQMAVFDVADDRFLLMPRDTAGTPDGAASAGREMLARGAQLLLGPLFSESVSAAAGAAREAGVNMVAFSNNRAVAGNGSYLIGLLPREQVLRIVNYAHSQGVLRYAALAPDTPYGRQVVADLTEAVAAVGGTLVRTAFFSDDPDDISGAVREVAEYDARVAALEELRAELTAKGEDIGHLKTLDTWGDVDFDALFVPSGGAQLRQIAALLPFYDVDTSKVRLLGMETWRTAGLGREPALVGAWFAAPITDTREDFEARYRELYGRTPHSLAVLAYDATALAAVLSRVDNGPSFDTEALTSPNGFAGAGGIFRFLPSGEVQRGLAVLEVEPWGFGILSPSPTTFETSSNEVLSN
jgi:ABC-type branched-subunit amino acid transport system substrate-binding protein